MIPTTAFVLGAGLGERLRPMTLATPKPLMPIWNQPLLEHTLRILESWGIQEVYINTHWLPDAMEAYVNAYAGSLKLHILHEPEILGTGGALRCMKKHLKDEAFWLINGDIVFQADATPIVEAFHRSGAFAAAWLDPSVGPRTVEMDFKQRITCWASPTPKVEHTYTFTGVSLLSKKVLNYLPETPKMCSIVEAFNAAMYDNHFVQGVVQKEAYWNDAGTPEAYLQVHRDAQRLPQLKAYTLHANTLPAPEVAQALAALHWDLADTIVIPMGKRGSNRTFWRLVHKKDAAIAIAYESVERVENRRYADCARCLKKAGVNVPSVLSDQPGLLLLQDLGDSTLDKHLPKNNGPEPIDKIEAAMKQLAKFHAAKTGTLELEPTFDQTLLEWEHNFYQTHVAPLPKAAQKELQQLIDVLSKEPMVLMHRDFQSTNILWYNKRPYIIDFQGMRKGPALYDLASFLYDPYLTWSDEVIQHAITTYALTAHRDAEEIRQKLPYAGLQRLLQAIGAYHRLASVGQTRFLAYIPTAQTRAINFAKALGLSALAKALDR
ncbi:MAG: sugar phosphate nucleotidyltransferase [bacterium]|nr:sugar phosphate nucleotidyltransferase [bacterium]